MLKRTEESFLTSWYFQIDRKLLFAVLILVAIGIWASLTAGSVAADRININLPIHRHLNWYHFFVHMIPFWIAGICTLFVASMMSRKYIMYIAWLCVIVCLVLLFITLINSFTPGAGIRGSVRWVSVFGFGFMPSELLKPGFVIITAWFLNHLQSKGAANIFTFNRRLWRWDGWPVYLLVFAFILITLFRHPDVGTAVLYFGALCIMLFMAGLPWKLLWAFVGVGLFGATMAFMFLRHVHCRIVTMLGIPPMGNFRCGNIDTWQVDRSVQAIQSGGLFGAGEDAFVKRLLPDSHTDFIFAAIAEDSGAILAAVLIFGMF
ncbi:MAG: FtsW/RodA/SpoVE family cell cycle protein, partial [Alphaproteobacteria bacterium]|nr:FtsW/RodA/SpoVE family cell cycle protein [Alphaproteobacteria bacterium]